VGKLKIRSHRRAHFGPAGDVLLEQMNIGTHSGGTSLAKFSYSYNADDNVKTPVSVFLERSDHGLPDSRPQIAHIIWPPYRAQYLMTLTALGLTTLSFQSEDWPLPINPAIRWGSFNKRIACILRLIVITVSTVT
jgi:hypothetical protein